MTNALVSAAAAAAFLAFTCGGSPVHAQQLESSATTAATVPAQTVSHGPRIVRLSQVNGAVELDRQTGHGFEAAFANLPIVQGSRLRTGDGVAEVEFEDNSSLRLTPNSLVEFPELSMSAGGARSSTIHVVQGAIYVSMTKTKGNNVNVTFGKESLTLDPSAHIALSLTGKQPRLDVFDGTVQAASGGIITTVGHKKGLLFDPADSAAPTLVSKNEKGPFDEWDKREAEYHQRFAPSSSSYSSVPYTYGLADMNYYGSFVNMGGCGMMWQPYLASANWSPFANGMWAWYPTAGYSWVSPYPWGWTAFHSGMWNYCPGAGWGWQPNNSWNGLQNTATIPKKLPTRLDQLKPPLGKPRPVGPTVVAVNEKPLVASRINNARDSFTFQKDSAGLGVPRGTFGKLDHISSNVMQHGTIERPVYVSSSPNDRGMSNTTRAGDYHGNMGTHTTPVTGRSGVGSTGGGVSGSHSVSSGSMGGGSHMGGSMPSGSMSAGGGAMGGASAPSGGHH